MKTRLFLMLSILILASLACNAFRPESTQEPEPTSNVLFQDDFSDTSSGWDQISVDKGETDYLDGVYRIYVNEANTDVWANPGLDFSDVRIEVDATKVSGADDNDYGVICRSMDTDNFYFFIISSDGYYGIGKVKGEDQTLIGNESMQSNDNIQQGEATNHIRAECIGNTLTLYVNGEKIAEAQDNDFASGDVGLIAGSFDTPGTDIHFDNFTVLKP